MSPLLFRLWADAPTQFVHDFTSICVTTIGVVTVTFGVAVIVREMLRRGTWKPAATFDWFLGLMLVFTDGFIYLFLGFQILESDGPVSLSNAFIATQGAVWVVGAFMLWARSTAAGRDGEQP